MRICNETNSRAWHQDRGQSQSIFCRAKWSRQTTTTTTATRWRTSTSPLGAHAGFTRAGACKQTPSPPTTPVTFQAPRAMPPGRNEAGRGIVGRQWVVWCSTSICPRPCTQTRIAATQMLLERLARS